jgi:hypothetical protein
MVVVVMVEVVAAVVVGWEWGITYLNRFRVERSTEGTRKRTKCGSSCRETHPRRRGMLERTDLGGGSSVSPKPELDVTFVDD